MPMKRKSTIKPIHSTAELLAFLQIEGHLDGVEMPDWMPGTSVAELFQALEYLGDASWLEGYYPGNGLQEGADRWVAGFLQGEQVPTIEDVEKGDDGEDHDDDAAGSPANGDAALAEYMYSLSATKKRAFLRRMKAEDGFREAAKRQLAALVNASAACAVASNEDFNPAKASLIKAISTDPLLIDMARFYLEESRDALIATWPKETLQASVATRMASIFASVKANASAMAVKKTKGPAGAKKAKTKPPKSPASVASKKTPAKKAPTKRATSTGAVRKPLK